MGSKVYTKYLYEYFHFTPNKIDASVQPAIVIYEVLFLIDKIVYGNLDITSESDCPQFQQVSPDDAERLVPLSAENEKEKSLLQKLIDSIKELFGFFKNFIAKIFGA